MQIADRQTDRQTGVDLFAETENARHEIAAQSQKARKSVTRGRTDHFRNILADQKITD